MEGRIRPSGLTEVTSRVDALPPHQPTPHHKESPPIPFKIAAPIIIATLGLAACGPISAKTSTPEGAFPTNAPTGEVVPANPTAIVAPAEAPTSAPTKVPEVVAPDVVDYTVDQLFIDAQYGYRYILSGNILSPMDNVPLEDANAAQWVLNAENNAQLVKERTGAAPSATLLFTNGKKDAESRNAAMSFSGNSIMWPSYSEGQSTFLSASPSEYWFPVQADQSKVTYQKVNLPAGYTSDDVRMGWVGDNQSVELAAKGGKGMLVFNPTTQEWREMKNIPSTELLTSVIAPFEHAFGDKVAVNGTEMDGAQLLAEIQRNPDTYIQKKKIGGQEYSFIVVNGTPIGMEGADGVWHGAIAYKSLKQPGTGPEIGASFAIWTGDFDNDPRYRDVFASNFEIAATDGSPSLYELMAKVPTDAKLTPEQIISYYDWTNIDKTVEFLTPQGIPIREMHLIDGYTTDNAPSWLSQLSDTDLEQYMTLHIQAILKRNHYVEATVVNEAFFGAGMPGNNFWYSRFGERYIEIAFNAARAASPDTKLILNDNIVYGPEGQGSDDGVWTNSVANGESSAIFSFVKKEKAKGIPIDGVGIESHIVASDFTSGDMQANIEKYQNDLINLMKKYQSIGVDVYLTEFDVNIGTLPADWTKEQKEELKAEIYSAVFEACFQSENCKSVTMWGFSNTATWMLSDGYPYGVGESPLPLDENYNSTASDYAIKKVLFNHLGDD